MSPPYPTSVASCKAASTPANVPCKSMVPRLSIGCLSVDAISAGARHHQFSSIFYLSPLTLMLQKIQAAKALSMVLKRSRIMGLLPTSSMWRPLGWTSKPARLMNP